MKAHHALETFIVFFDTLLAAMWVAMGCVVALNTLPLDRADAVPAQPAFDAAMPALPIPQETEAGPRAAVAGNPGPA